MHLDVIEIRNFYQGRLGQLVREQISLEIQRVWSDENTGSMDKLSIAGIGYAVPYLEDFLKKAKSVSAFCPAGQGAIVWPSEGARRSVLVHDDMFPVEDDCFDRIIAVHGLEFIADAKAHLDEVWRVLKPQGRFLIIVPNRRGLWARVDTTPFGNGQPYSRGQLHELLCGARFSPHGVHPLIHFAPFDTAFRITANSAIERIGSKVWPHFSGALMIEAVKETVQPVQAEGVRVLNPKRARQTATKPAPA